MIVRDAELTLGACLQSVRGIVDEIHVADTGSRDGTADVARHHGAKVISVPWEKDFARARNRALIEVHTDWVLMLDADELLDPHARELLPPLLEASGVAGYQVTIRNYVESMNERIWDRPAHENDSSFEPARQFPAYIEHENVRLFRRHPEIYFVGRVHESVGPRLLETGRTIARANFLIHHFGMVAEPQVRARKNRLYRELGRWKVREMPHDAQAHFELGLVEFDNFHNYPEALKCFQRACRLNSRLSVAWLFAALAHLRLNAPREALQCLKKAEQQGYHTALLPETQGDAHYNLGQFESACRCYERALERSGGAACLLSKLGLAEVRAGRIELGVGHMRAAIERQPNLPELYDRLIAAAVWLERLEMAAEVAERKIVNVEAKPEAYLRAASIRVQKQEWQRAAQLLDEGLRHFPDAERLQAAKCELATCTAARAHGLDALSGQAGCRK